MSIPEKMKAAVLFGYNDLRVVEQDVPIPDNEEVLIKVKTCAICGGDPAIIAKGWPGSPPFGKYIPGHELSGEIVAVGKDVLDYKIGDRVATSPHKGCGHCMNCIRGLYTTCLNYGNLRQGHKQYGFTVNGGYAEYALSHIKSIYRLPKNISFDAATLLTVGGAVLYGMERLGWFWPGEFVVVIGPGPIGLMAIQLAKVCGARKVLISGTRDSRLEVAKKIGVDYTVNVKNENLKEKVASLTDAIMADLVIEASGAKDACAEAIEIVKKSGRVSYLGLYSDRSIPIDLFKVVMNNLQIAGGRGEGGCVIDRLIPLMEDNRIKTEELITHRFPLERINDAMEVFVKRSGGAIKVVINP